MGKSIQHLRGKELAKAALMKLLPISKEKFYMGSFSDGINRCCIIGHLMRLENNPKHYNLDNCSDSYTHPHPIRYLSLKELPFISIVEINNRPRTEFLQNNSKDRVIAFLRQYIKEQESCE